MLLRTARILRARDAQRRRQWLNEHDGFFDIYERARRARSGRL